MKCRTTSLLGISISDYLKVTINASTMVKDVDPNTWLNSSNGQGYMDALIGYDQKGLGLPSTALKPTEKCAGDWMNRWN